MSNNNLAQCRTCGKALARSAKTCPHCGEKTLGIDQKKATKRILVIMAVVVAAAVIISVFGNGP